jgi:hypothetical protein
MLFFAIFGTVLVFGDCGLFLPPRVSGLFNEKITGLSGAFFGYK